MENQKKEYEASLPICAAGNKCCNRGCRIPPNDKYAIVVDTSEGELLFCCINCKKIAGYGNNEHRMYWTGVTYWDAVKSVYGGIHNFALIFGDEGSKIFWAISVLVLGPIHFLFLAIAWIKYHNNKERNKMLTLKNEAKWKKMQ